MKIGEHSRSSNSSNSPGGNVDNPLPRSTAEACVGIIEAGETNAFKKSLQLATVVSAAVIFFNKIRPIELSCQSETIGERTEQMQST